MKEKTKKVFIFGAFCQDNLGDDMFIYSLFYFFRKNFKRKFKIYVACPNPKNIYFDLPSQHIQYVSSRNLIRVSYYVYKSTCIFLGPGNIFGLQFKDLKTSLFLVYLCILSKLFKKKVISLGVDISTRQHFVLKFLSFFVLLLNDSIYVRFKEDFFFISRVLKINPNKIVIMNDLVYNYLFYSWGQKIRRKKKKIEKVKIGVVLSNLAHLPNYSHIERLFVSLLRFLNKIEEKGYISYKILILNNGSNKKDLNLILYLNRKYKLGVERNKIITFKKFNKKNIYNLFNLVSSYDLIVSNKLHSSIIATLLQLDYISISYHEKMSKLNKLFKLNPKYELEIYRLSSHNYRHFESKLHRVILDRIESKNSKTIYEKKLIKTITELNEKVIKDLLQKIN